MNEDDKRGYIKMKIKFLVLLIVFTVIMLVLSTYAWFSTQRTVSLNGISGNVNVAEGLEISLDARNWSNSIDLSSITNLKNYAKEQGYTNNNNIIPTELLPVSTEGSTGDNYIKMYKGEATTNSRLTKITMCDENETSNTEDDYPNYIAFDVFLRDSSRTNDAVPLYLTTNSTVTVKANGENEEQYGLQNTIRVGFAKYNITAEYKADQTTILSEIATTTNKISQMAIWEPNANYHVNYTVINNNNFTVSGLTNTILRDADGKITETTPEEKVKFTRDDLINTYALKDGASYIFNMGDVYNWTSTDYFIKQNTVKTKIQVPAYTDTTYVTAETYPGDNGYAMVGEDEETGVLLTDTTSDQNTFSIVGNEITRIRIYVWLEGQDVDCINYASHGGGITVSMGLKKEGGSTIEPTPTQTPEPTNVPELSAVSLEKVYGKNENGVAYFKLVGDYDDTNNHIEYQILNEGEEVNEENWKSSDKLKNVEGGEDSFADGCVVKGLSVGNKIYTRVVSGDGTITDGGTVEINTLETFSAPVSSNYTYRDSEGKTAIIPKGFKYGTSSLNNKISTGLVIEDENGNQFVWVPVENAIYDETTEIALSTNHSTYKPMARKQSGYDNYYEGIFYDFSGTKSYLKGDKNDYNLGTSDSREPSLVTWNSSNYSWQYTAGTSGDAYAKNYEKLAELKNDTITISSAETFGQYLNMKYSEMIESVDSNGGFYVGRYETSLTGNTVKTTVGVEPAVSIGWYDMYVKQNSDYEENPYYTNTSVQTEMIGGSQWDAMLNYILKGADKDKVTIKQGNHSDTMAVTGEYPNDIMNNIFDLASNVRERTSEAKYSSDRTGRGAFYSAYATNSPSVRFWLSTSDNDNYTGTRMILYIK